MAWTTPKTWTTGELVTAVDLNTHVRDNLNFLYTPNFQEAVAGVTDFTTTSTTYVDITGLSVNINTTGGNLLVVAFGWLTANSMTFLAVNIDGTDYQVNAIGGTATAASYVCAFRRFAVSAGSHTVKLRLSVNNSSYPGSFNGGSLRRLMVAEGVL